jgi:predicted O-methyltransferase YrrM
MALDKFIKSIDLPGVRSVCPLKLYEEVSNKGSSACDTYLFLYALVAITRPRVIVDVGTQSGRSAIAMAAALADHELKGHVWSIDLPTNKYHLDAVKKTQMAGLSTFITFLREDAATALPSLAQAFKKQSIDLAFIDEAKENYERDFLVLRLLLQLAAFHDVEYPQYSAIIQSQIESLKAKCLEFEFITLHHHDNIWASFTIAQRRM